MITRGHRLARRPTRRQRLPAQGKTLAVGEQRIDVRATHPVNRRARQGEHARLLAGAYIDHGHVVMGAGGASDPQREGRVTGERIGVLGFGRCSGQRGERHRTAAGRRGQFAVAAQRGPHPDGEVARAVVAPPQRLGGGRVVRVHHVGDRQLVVGRGVAEPAVTAARRADRPLVNSRVPGQPSVERQPITLHRPWPIERGPDRVAGGRQHGEVDGPGGQRLLHHDGGVAAWRVDGGRRGRGADAAGQQCGGQYRSQCGP